MDEKQVIQIARVCHEANREYCRTLGDNSQPADETKKPITLEAVLAVVDETHARNVSAENWHSRVTNALKEKFGEALEGLGDAIGEAKFGG